MVSGIIATHKKGSNMSAIYIFPGISQCLSQEGANRRPVIKPSGLLDLKEGVLSFLKVLYSAPLVESIHNLQLKVGLGHMAKITKNIHNILFHIIRS